MKTIVLLMFVLLVSSVTALIAEPQIPCADCQFVFGSQGFCDASTNFVCYRQGDAVLPTCGNLILEGLEECDDGNLFDGDGCSSLCMQELNNSVVTITLPDFSAIEARIAPLEIEINTIRQQIQQLESKVTNLDVQRQQLQALEASVSSIEQRLEGRVGSLSTGLAAVQQDVETTKSDLANLEVSIAEGKSFTRLIIWIGFILIVIIAASLLIYYMTQRERKVNPQITNYITKHIKQGIKFPHVKQNLLRAGWSEGDINWAYKETMKKNYQQYKAGRKPVKVGYDNKKMILIATISILILIGGGLVLRGVTTGKAIHFQTTEELETAVKTAIDRDIASSSFYPLINQGSFCIEVHDDYNWAAFKVQKNGASHTTTPAIKSCSTDITFDASVKFNNWESFESMGNGDCADFRNSHLIGDLVILPSRLILPGFRLNPTVDYSQYCTFLSSCLAQEELTSIGC